MLENEDFFIEMQIKAAIDLVSSLKMQIIVGSLKFIVGILKSYD